MSATGDLQPVVVDFEAWTEKEIARCPVGEHVAVVS